MAEFSEILIENKNNLFWKSLIIFFNMNNKWTKTEQKNN